MRRCTEVTVKVGEDSYLDVEVGGTLTGLGMVTGIHVHDEGVALYADERWVLVPWHRVRSVGGEGTGGWA